MEKLLYKFKKITAIYISIINYIIQPDKFNGSIHIFKKVIIILLLLIGIFHKTIFSLDEYKSLYISIIFLILSSLFFFAKALRNSEEMDIYHGFLKIEKKIFKQVDSIFSIFMVVIFTISFFSFLLTFFINLNIIYDGFLVKNSETNTHYTNFFIWLLFIFKVILPYKLINYVENSLYLQTISFTNIGEYLIGLSRFIIGYFIISTIKKFISKRNFEKKLFKALITLDDENKADIQFIQERMSLLPNAFKKKLLEHSIKNDNDIIKRRVISVLFHSKTISFVETFLYNLLSQSNNIKKLGLKKIIDLLNNSTISWTQNRLHSIIKKTSYLRKKEYHNKSILKLLEEIYDLSKNKLIEN